MPTDFTLVRLSSSLQTTDQKVSDSTPYWCSNLITNDLRRNSLRNFLDCFLTVFTFQTGSAALLQTVID